VLARSKRCGGGGGGEESGERRMSGAGVGVERWAMRGGLCKIACGRFYAKMMKISKFLFFASK
jgi:hypothetical protein